MTKTLEPLSVDQVMEWIKKAAFPAKSPEGYMLVALGILVAEMRALRCQVESTESAVEECQPGKKRM